MKVFKVTSICFGPYDCDCKHRTGHVVSIIVAEDEADARGQISARLNTMFRDDPITLNTRFNHSCEHILTARDHQIAGIIFIDRVIQGL